MKNKIRKPLILKLGVSLIRLLSITWRMQVTNPPQSKAIVVFWHGKMLPLWRLFAFKNSSAIVSQSKDGEILSTLLRKWSFELFRGSSSKGGAIILNNICKQFDKDFLLITPDGPRGPAKTFKAGAAIISKKLQIPLVLCSIKIHSKKEFPKSWDSFQFPLPFSKIHIDFSNKIQIPEEASREEISDFMKSFEEKM